MILRAFPIALLLITSAPISAEVAIAARNIRPGEVMSVTDVMVIRGEASGAFKSADLIVGAEAKVALYAGRVILTSQIVPAASVQRNQIVEIRFSRNGLSMSTDGRALGRGSAGQRIRVMNLASKTSIFGTIQSDGSVRVSK
jgi:flagella basal body P-ring formation protein FlgA